MQKTPWLVENPPVRTPRVTAQTVMDRVTERWSNAHGLPPLTPHLSRQVERVAFRPRMAVADADALAHQDPLLVALVLREANRAQACASLAGALEILRPDGVREVLHRVAHGADRIHDADVVGWMTEVQHYAWRLSRAAVTVARQTPLEVERVRTAALLVDVGLLVGLTVLADGWTVRKQPRQVMDLLEAGQHTLGWFLADAWGLPDEVAQVIAHGGSHEIDGHTHPTLAALCVARSLLFDMGLDLRLPCMRGGPPHPVQVEESLGALDIGRTGLLLVRAEARAQLMG